MHTVSLRLVNVIVLLSLHDQPVNVCLRNTNLLISMSKIQSFVYKLIDFFWSYKFHVSQQLFQICHIRHYRNRHYETKIHDAQNGNGRLCLICSSSVVFGCFFFRSLCPCRALSVRTKNPDVPRPSPAHLKRLKNTIPILMGSYFGGIELIGVQSCWIKCFESNPGNVLHLYGSWKSWSGVAVRLT